MDSNTIRGNADILSSYDATLLLVGADILRLIINYTNSNEIPRSIPSPLFLASCLSLQCNGRHGFPDTSKG